MYATITNIPNPVQEVGSSQFAWYGRNSMLTRLSSEGWQEGMHKRNERQTSLERGKEREREKQGGTSIKLR